jgi:hypothetical protein
MRHVVALVDAWVVNAGASDHLPVVARLEAPRRF